ncbi:RidA family protein [Phytoactinopolyspora limicola]|uniref:RidA family protein n=1 Tax=Phytoactinopolyspora limicola TaxID=2715536 RepID=UPI001408714C|nr:RidA family protein [Phytoactinopolyspora limicola]
MLTPVNPPTLPASPFYSHGVEVFSAQRLLFISGQVGVDADGDIPDGIAAQARLANNNLEAVLAAAGMASTDIVKATIYLTNRADIEPFMAATHDALTDPPPATTLLIVQGLADPRLLVEIEAVAAQTAHP